MYPSNSDLPTGKGVKMTGGRQQISRGDSVQRRPYAAVWIGEREILLYE